MSRPLTSKKKQAAQMRRAPSTGTSALLALRRARSEPPAQADHDDVLVKGLNSVASPVGLLREEDPGKVLRLCLKAQKKAARA